MRILAISDIHNNMLCTRKLCEQASVDRYDVVVVAGDIGDEIANEFFVALERFNCPILYVYGNWDGKLDYQTRYTNNSFHLDSNIIQIGDYYFTGFSGCENGWGNNPEKIKAVHEVNVKHKNIAKHVREVNECVKKEEILIGEEFDKKISKLQMSALDKRRKEYKDKLSRLRDRRFSKIVKAREQLKILRTSDRYNKYATEYNAAINGVRQANIEKIVRMSSERSVDHGRMIVITHDRVYGLDKCFPNPPLLHLFGHRHGFKHTSYKGTEFVNVSTLEGVDLVVPKNATNINGDISYLRKSHAGTYCVLILMVIKL